MSAEGAQVAHDDEALAVEVSPTETLPGPGDAPELHKVAPAERAGDDATPVERAEHPAGEAFFSGEGLSDAEADDIARQQLMRSGMLRGQRVRVGD